MISDISSINTTTSGKKGVANTTYSAVGNLIRLLPTGTVFLFQFLNPVVTNSGHCNTTNKVLSSVLLVLCGFSCAFSSFTDSYVGSDNQRHYGIVTTKGLWPSPASDSKELPEKLEFGDFVHAVFSLVVFAILGLLDTNTVHCFYPGFESTQKSLLQVLPIAVGVVAGGGVFMIFPHRRHGIGYPPTTTESNKDNTLPPQNPNDNNA